MPTSHASEAHTPATGFPKSTPISAASDVELPRDFLARFRTREQATHYRDRYRTGRRGKIDAKERAVMRALISPLGPLSVALDIPSGTGRLSSLLMEFADTTILADASPIMLELAREELGAERVAFLQTDAEQIGLADASADLVFCHRLLHHLHDVRLRARIFGELARVSRRYVLLTYFTPGFRDRFRWWIGRAGGRARADTRPVLKRGFLRECAAAGLRPIAQRAIRRFPLAAEFILFEKVTA